MNPLISFSQVVAGYNVIEAVGPLSFELQLGEVICLEGASSSGKSTVLKSILGRAEILSGELKVRNTTNKKRLLERRIENIGVIWQPRELIGHISVIESLEIVGCIDEHNIWRDPELKQLFECTPLVKRTKVTACSLSGGEQTLLNWLLAFQRAEYGVLIVDEGVASLQSEMAKLVIWLLEKKLREKKIGVITAGGLPFLHPEAYRKTVIRL